MPKVIAFILHINQSISELFYAILYLYFISFKPRYVHAGASAASFPSLHASKDRAYLHGLFGVWQRLFLLGQQGDEHQLH